MLDKWSSEFDFYKIYEEKLEYINHELNNFIKNLPYELRSLGQYYFDTCCYGECGYNTKFVLLPYWITEGLELNSDEYIDKVALVNAFGNIYFRIQDDLIDIGAEYRSELILFGSIIYHQFLSLIDNLKDIEFEDIFSYLVEYHEVLAWEKNRNDKSIITLDNNFLVNIGKKFSPLKISCLLIMKHYKLMESVLFKLEAFIEFLSIAGQLMNDIYDWKDDLIKKNYTYVVCSIISELGLEKTGDEELLPKSYELIKSTNLFSNMIDLSNEKYLCAQNLNIFHSNSHIVRHLVSQIEYNNFIKNEIRCISQKHSELVV